MRTCGILFPVSSLPSRYGIGCFSREAFQFIDFLHDAGQGCWQILPVGPTGYGDSPYQPVSAFAGNPYFISPEVLTEEGFLKQEECDSRNWGSDPERVDYGALYTGRQELLRLAFGRFPEKLSADRDLRKEWEAFAEKEQWWLDDYALYMTIKELSDGRAWSDWEEPLRMRDEKALDAIREQEKEKLQYYSFLQFLFSRQWDRLRAYAKEKQVRIIGDIPFYAAMDSADTWAHPEVFMMDKDRRPAEVAGCPPDAFSPTGQKWGNPVYDWKKLKKAGYDWWIRRMERSLELYDVLRIDHFHGFDQYYAIPAADETAENGVLCKGPGLDFFRVLREKLGDIPVIAEDLGNVTEENLKLLKEIGFPGMKVLQYAYTSWDSIYLTHRHEKNCVVYTGTHDNTTALAWVEDLRDGERDYVRRYINSENTDYGRFVWDFIREAYRSVADLCIIPLQDYLVKGREARLNAPGTAEGNWQWRLLPGFLSGDLCRSIRGLSELYGRIPQEEKDE